MLQVVTVMKKSPLPAADTKRPPQDGSEPPSVLRKKWRAACDTGFVAVPNVLLTYFRTLGVTPTEFVVLLNVLAHWWTAEARPFPRVATIARRMKTSPRTVQRALNRLRVRGLIDWQRVQVKDGKIVPGAYPGEGIRRRLYDLRPLVDVADRLAVDRLDFVAERADRGRHTEIAA
jgi:hypothetical protein